MERFVEQEALERGLSEADVAQAALDELDAQITKANRELGSNNLQAGGAQQLSGSKPKANKPIGASRYSGDVFYTPSSTAGVNHGHSGIYSSRTQIIEATPSAGVARKHHSAVNVSSGAQLQYVNTTQTNRNKAANRATSYIGRGYNYAFAFNRTANGRMNCSQLVWAAYKTATGIDLDANGGAGVYPRDIRDSSRTVTYKWY